MATYPLLSIGQKGAFTFASPYNKDEYKNVELEVVGVRTLTDLVSSNLRPFESIYEPMGLTQEDFVEDLNQKVPIVTFKSTNNSLLYVPCDRVLSYPDITGVKYQENILAISLGAIPVATDLEKVKEAVIETIYSLTGIKSTIEVVKGSSTVLVSKDEDAKFKKLLASRKTEDKSYRIKYEELLETYKKQKKEYDALIECVKKHCINTPKS